MTQSRENELPKKGGRAKPIANNKSYQIEIAEAHRRYLTIMSEKEGRTTRAILEEIISEGVKRRMMKLVREIDGY